MSRFEAFFSVVRRVSHVTFDRAIVRLSRSPGFSGGRRAKGVFLTFHFPRSPATIIVYSPKHKRTYMPATKMMDWHISTGDVNHGDRDHQTTRRGYNTTQSGASKLR